MDLIINGIKEYIMKEGISGNINSSPSKSYSHRAFFLSLISRHNIILRNCLDIGDVEKTIKACRMLGANIKKLSDNLNLNQNSGDIANKEKINYLIEPPKEFHEIDGVIDCGNSGTTIRILAALSILFDFPVMISGLFFKRKRPILPLLEALLDIGAEITIIDNEGRPFNLISENTKLNTDLNEKQEDKLSKLSSQTLNGVNRNYDQENGETLPKDLNERVISSVKIFCKKINKSYIKIRGDISSQFITGLIIAACGLIARKDIAMKKGLNINSKTKENYFYIKTTTPVKSYPYLLITKDICKKFGYNLEYTLDKNRLLEIKINLNQDRGNIKDMVITGRNLNKDKENNLIYTIPGDFSSASFILTAGALYSKDWVKIQSLSSDNVQGDRAIIEILKNMGAKINVDSRNTSVMVARNSDAPIFDDEERYMPYLNGLTIDCKDIPDLFPILCVAAMYARGKTKFINIEHIMLKETNRVMVMYNALKKFGVKQEIEDNSYTIEGINKDFYINLEKKIKDLEDNMIIIETYGDHRIIMALIIASLGLSRFLGSKSFMGMSPQILIKDVDKYKDSYPKFFNDLNKLKINLKI
ncbi:MAG: 3-phosphoshikimate 1-carboxyvinyltransferase [Promethearchaeota archaeon]